MSRATSIAGTMQDFPFASGFSAPVSVALWMTVASIAASLLLLLYTLELRFRRRLRERRRAGVIAHWRAVIAAAVTGAAGVAGAAPKLRRRERQEFLRLWVYTRSMLEGAAADRLIALAQGLGLTDFVRTQASHAHLGTRLMAMQALGFLRDADSVAALAAALDDANTLVSITAAEALAAIDPARGVGLLIPKIASRRDWPRTHVFKVLQRAGSAVISEPLYRCIRAAADDDAAYMMQFAEIAEFDVRDALAVELLHSRTDPEVVAAALKLATGHAAIPRIDEFLAHPAWYVRMQAAKLVGRIRRPEDVSRLEKLLADEEWWVRYRAAKALVRLPGVDAPGLEQIRLRLHDRYARDILGQAMAEAGRT
jgi:HEAT repeat protein